MSKLWNWCKSFFVKAQPVVHRFEPLAADLATKIDPSLAPKIAAATAAYGAVRGVLNEKA